MNEYVTYHHFKMESLQATIQLLKKVYWMAVLDLKDAYYSVPIKPQHRKFLRIEFNLYEFACLPNGLASVPRVFYKSHGASISNIEVRRISYSSLHR